MKQATPTYTHVLLLTLPGSPVQHLLYCDSEEEARGLIDAGTSIGRIDTAIRPESLGFATYQTGPGTFYLVLTRKKHEELIQRAQSPLLVPGPGQGGRVQ